MGLTIHLNARDLSFSRKTSERLSSLSKTLRNLSAGVKTSAAELGGATLSIHERFLSELHGARAELRGVQSNSSLLQTVEGALAEATDNLQKMRELAVRAGAGGLSLEDREALEADFKELMAQVDAISEQATYNGRKILNGEHSPLNISLVGDRDSALRAPEAADNIQLMNLKPDQLGKHVRHEGMGRGVFLSELKTGELSVNGVKIRGTSRFDDQSSYCYASGSAIAKAAAINASTEHTGVWAEADMNVYRAYEPIVGATLDRGRWISINGFKVSGFSFEDRDATGSLRQALNEGLAQTGVVARLDDEGKLLLAAVDGRNITIEFSDIPLRNQLAVRDLNGDPINFSVDVDPPRYERHGDITSVEYVTSAGGLLDTPEGSFSGSFNVLDSRFNKAQDRVDYIFEVVKAGELGEAKFRVIEEQVPHMMSDELVEGYDFIPVGRELSAPSSEKVRIDGSQYQGASLLSVNLKVIDPGSPESTIESERPLVEVYLTSLDDASVAPVTLGQFRISNDQTLDLSSAGLKAQLHFPIDERRSLSLISRDPITGAASEGAALSLGQALSPLTVPDGHDYPLHPLIEEWDGIHSADIKIEVVEDGHAMGNRVYSFVDELPAKIKVTAELLYQGRSVERIYELDEVFRKNELDGLYRTELSVDGSADESGGIGVVFPSSFGVASASRSGTTTGAYNRLPSVVPYRYVGEEKREYVVTFTSDGIMSNQLNDGGPSAKVEVFGDESGVRTLLDTYTIDEVSTDRAYFMGEGDEKDGFYIVFPRGPSLSYVKRSRDPGGVLSFSSHLYNTQSDRVGVVEITKAGSDLAPNQAEWIYYYEDDPDTIVGTGLVSKYTNLPDQTQMRSSVQLHFRSETDGFPNNVAFIRDIAYTQPFGASFTSELVSVEIEDPDAPEDAEPEYELKLKTSWRLENGTMSTTLIDVESNQYLNIGYGVQMYFYRDRLDVAGGFQEGLKFSGSMTQQNRFEVGDTFSYQILQNPAAEGDTFTATVHPVDLAVGASWELRATGPDWKPNDLYAVELGTGFDPEAQLLDGRISYGETLGEIEVTGSGRFEVGDQIRVETRGFVGEVRTSGAYTNPAFPTDYVLTVTKAGAIDEAELSWVRDDGLTDTDGGGSGVLTGLSEGLSFELEEGVKVSFHDLGEGAYLAEGDEIRIAVGRNLKYTFGGQVTLHSAEAIDVEYAEDATDQALGRLLFTGTEEQALSPKFTELSLQSGKVAVREDSSLAHSGLMSHAEVREALTTIDAALNEIAESRTQVGAFLNRLDRQSESLTQKVVGFYGVTQRLTGVDYASETASLSAEQIQLMSAPMLSDLAEVNARRVLDLITLNGAR